MLQKKKDKLQNILSRDEQGQVRRLGSLNFANYLVGTILKGLTEIT